MIGVRDRPCFRALTPACQVGVPRFKGSYDALLDDPDIDAVYLPLPNSLHAEWASRAVARGKHVLCEKPISVNASEAKAMFGAARANDVRLVEAYPYLAQPQTLVLRQLLQESAIGRLQLIRAHFGFNAVNLRLDPAGAPNVRFVPGLGGGALLDAGSYAVSFVRTRRASWAAEDWRQGSGRHTRASGGGRWDQEGREGSRCRQWDGVAH